MKASIIGMSTTTLGTSTTAFAEVPLTAIRPNPGQPRRYFDQTTLAELAASIAANGLLQPVTVRPDPDGEAEFLIVAGERRWRAAQLAGLGTVPARVITGLDSVDAYVLAVTENVNRTDMTPIEEADAYAQLLAAGKTTDQVGALFGRRPADVRYRVDLLRCRVEVQDLIAKGGMGLNLAWYVSELSPAGQQRLTARHAQGRYRDDREAIEVAKAMKAAEAETPMFEVADWTPTRPAKPRPTPVALAVGKVDELIADLARVSAADPAALADTEALGAALDRLKKATADARRTVRTATARRLVGDDTPPTNRP
jgi:ParB family chromosome partitioning protein